MAKDQFGNYVVQKMLEACFTLVLSCFEGEWARRMPPFIASHQLVSSLRIREDGPVGGRSLRWGEILSLRPEQP